MSDSALTPELIHATSLAAIVQSSEDAIISKNLDGVIQTWNSAAEHMFGYSAAEAIGQPIRLIIPDDRLEEERGILRQLRDGNRIEHFETIRITKDGRRLHISLTVSPIRDRNGRVVGASKIARDISQQKRDHEALEETQKRLAVTLQSIGDAVLATDREGRVTFLNTVAETLMRAGQQDIVGRSIVDVFNIQDETTGLALESPVEQVLRERRAVGMAHSTMLRRTDGTSIPIDDCAAPILGEQGELIGVVMVFRDVSAHRMAQRAASLLAEVVTSSNDAVVTKDLSGCVTSWNQAAEKIFGYTSAEMVGRSILAIIPTDRHAEEADILAKLARGERIDHYETVRQRKDGSLRQISVTISPLYDVDGRVVGASKIARDVTEQRRTQRALQETQERWKVTLRSIGDGVIVTDTSGRIAFANPVALELIQKTEGEVLGTPLAEVFAIAHETTKEAVENPVNRVLRDGGRVGLARHTVLLQPSGSEIPIDDSAAPIRSDDGQLLGVVLVFREIIERREAERQLTRWGQELEQRVAQRTNELVHSQKQLRALAAQLRTTEQRERRRLATDLHDYLAQLLALGRLKLTQIKHIAQVDSPRLEPMLLEAEQLLDQCLSYTRTLMAQLSPSVLHDLGLLAGLRWLAERMQEQGLMVEVRAADTQLPALEDSQADMVFQTVRELLMNVIKHAGVSRASVTVEMRSRSELRIVVQDEGRGSTYRSSTGYRRERTSAYSAFRSACRPCRGGAAWNPLPAEARGWNSMCRFSPSPRAWNRARPPSSWNGMKAGTPKGRAGSGAESSWSMIMPWYARG